MNALSDDHSHDPVLPVAPPTEAWLTNDFSGNPFSAPLPEGWRRIPTGLRGTRLFRITPPTGSVYWVAVMMLGRKPVSKHFTVELHARAWLTFVSEKRPAVTTFDLEERNGSFRTAALLRSG